MSGKSIEVNIKLTVLVAEAIEKDPLCRVILADGSLLVDLIAKLNIPARYTKLIFVNGIQVGLDSPLAENDTVVFLPYIGGG